MKKTKKFVTFLLVSLFCVGCITSLERERIQLEREKLQFEREKEAARREAEQCEAKLREAERGEAEQRAAQRQEEQHQAELRDAERLERQKTAQQGQCSTLFSFLEQCHKGGSGQTVSFCKELTLGVAKELAPKFRDNPDGLASFSLMCGKACVLGTSGQNFPSFSAFQEMCP